MTLFFCVHNASRNGYNLKGNNIKLNCQSRQNEILWMTITVLAVLYEVRECRIYMNITFCYFEGANSKFIELDMYI